MYNNQGGRGGARGGRRGGHNNEGREFQAGRGASQQQVDDATMAIHNPNVVGSGFIAFPPQVPGQTGNAPAPLYGGNQYGQFAAPGNQGFYNGPAGGAGAYGAGGAGGAFGQGAFANPGAFGQGNIFGQPAGYGGAQPGSTGAPDPFATQNGPGQSRFADGGFGGGLGGGPGPGFDQQAGGQRNPYAQVQDNLGQNTGGSQAGGQGGAPHNNAQRGGGGHRGRQPPSQGGSGNTSGSANVFNKPTQMVQGGQPSFSDDEKDEAKEWACPRCTFLNRVSAKQCAMCGGQAPKKKSAGGDNATQVMNQGRAQPQSTGQSGGGSGKSKAQKRRERKKQRDSSYNRSQGVNK